jgi:hypothetical protein
MNRALHPSRRIVVRLVVSGTGLALSHAAALAKAASIYMGRFSDLGLGGHDPVAYFATGRPSEGSPRHVARWNGAAWRASPRPRAWPRSGPTRSG